MGEIEKLSSITLSERVSIIATLNAIDNKAKFECQTCLKSQQGEMLEKWRRIKGCWKEQSRAVFQSDDIEFYRCPGNYFSYQVVQLLGMEQQFEKGVMPFEGSMMAQPAKILEIFYMIQRYRQDKLDKDSSNRKLQEKVASRNGRRNRSRR